MSLQESIDGLIRKYTNWKRPIVEVEKDVENFCEQNDCYDKKYQIINSIVEIMYQTEETIKLF